MVHGLETFGINGESSENGNKEKPKEIMKVVAPTVEAYVSLVKFKKKNFRD